MNKIIIVSAPSGSGKSTLIKKLMSNQNIKLKFSVSATTRSPRNGEVDGKDYYFLDLEDFRKRIANNEFVEYEQVYEGRYYGTLKSEIDRIFAENYNIIFDVDVVGGVNLKKIFGNTALSIFIKPPSVEELRKRLVNRSTDSEEEINKRISKAELELTYEPKFDHTVVNDDLETAAKEFYDVVNKFLEN